MWSHPIMFASLGVFLIATVISVFAGLNGVKLAHLVRDPAAVYKYPSYVGFFSHVGIFFMVSTAAITGFAAWLSRNLERENYVVLAAASVLSGTLVLDDVFMLHEEASRLGEVAIFAVYGLIGLGIWHKLRGLDGRYDLNGFRIAIFFLGLSVFTDVFKIYGPFSHWLEDFSKLSGFAAWLMFWAGFSRQTLTSD
ncbi:MAG: hypothetical protein AAGA78_14160 [Pseudomonadota bacterium]